MSDELEIVGNDDLEARIVTVILGEASDFERAEIARLCEEKPELAVFRRRLEMVDGLLGEARQREPKHGDDTAWQLSGKRREAVLAKLGEKETIVKVPASRWKVRPTLLRLVAMLLVFIAVMGVTISVMMQPAGQASLALQEPETITYSAAEQPFVASAVSPKPFALSAPPAPPAPDASMAKVIAASTASPTAIPVPSSRLKPNDATPYGIAEDFGSGWGDSGGGGGGWLSTEGVRSGDSVSEEKGADKFLYKPGQQATAGASSFGQGSLDSAPKGGSPRQLGITSKFTDVTQNNTEELGFDWMEDPFAGEVAPTRRDRELSLDDVNLGKLAGKKDTSSRSSLPAGVESATESLMAGRDAYRGKDYEAAHREYKVALEKLPVTEELEPLRDEIQAHLSDSAVALSQQYRRVGKYDEAKSQLQEFVEADESIAGQLPNLGDEPIRTNPSLTADHGKKVDEVRGLLYRGEGFIALGEFDQAHSAFESVLRIDPENKAARRWLERVDDQKADNYRAAYDQTRAELLVEVDKAWELPIPAEETPLDEQDASSKDDSTFSLNISDVSFKLAQAALAKGQWPETVRVEEFVNAFTYDEVSLRPTEQVGITMEQAAHPFLAQRNLLRLSLQTAATGRASGVPLRLTVVLDKSGSMERRDRSSAIEEAFRVLTEQLNPGDQVSLISFSRAPKLLVDSLDGSEGARLLEILRETPSEGGTNVEEALKLARSKAVENHLPGAQNRIVLLTDGIANLGNAVPEELMKIVEEARQEGIAFDACGVGVEGLNDDILEALTRKGDGRYYILGSSEDSGADFARQVAGALRPAAQNVKVQVEWNAERVGKWRLYGFEKHELAKEDFRNDSVDAAEMAAEEEGVAIYHVEVNPDGEGPLGVARVRFRDVASGEMVEREWEIVYEGEAAPFPKADLRIRLAGAAALTAEKLARSAVGERVEWDALLAEVRTIKGLFPKQARVGDLEVMIEQAKSIQ